VTAEHAAQVARMERMPFSLVIDPWGAGRENSTGMV